MAQPAAATVETEGQDDDILVTARKEYERCREAWNDNHDEAKKDLKFARLGGDHQWHGNSAEARRKKGRPAESFNKMPAFIRQVVNDARQNKPSIRVHPQDSGADKRVAEIINGLIRNIETTSDADVAYDTAIEHAVGQGFGFWRINTAYTCDDAFDQDIVIERVSNPFTVFGDPRSTAADSSDWNVAFIITTLTKDEFEREYPEAEKTDWDHDFADCPKWLDGDDVTVAEYWTREKVKREVVALSDGSIVSVEQMKEKPEDFAGLNVVGQPREVESWKVTQRIISGAEVLKTVEWAGRYIPIVPVYGDEVIDDDGSRHFRSLIRDAKGAQRTFNYMRNVGIEALGLAPRVPYIGKKGAFASDPNWDTANNESHSYLEYDGDTPPQRQPLPSHYQAAAQEALIAADDMKSIIGIYDASLGARSNETSGRAIMARQREGDVSTFHFIDNLSRAIRHGGRILLDLIPKVYTTERMIRVLGEDLKPDSVQNVPIAPTGQPVREVPQPDGSVSAIYDLTVGKYDLTVAAGPSFTTRREEAAAQMESLIQRVPQAGQLIGDIYAEALDWPMADKIAERLKLLLPPEARGEQAQIPPDVQQQLEQSQQMIQEGSQILQQQQQQLQAAMQEIERLNNEAQGKAEERQLKAREISVKEYEAETERLRVQRETFMAPDYGGPSPTGFPGAA